jgi:hypothetical protein
MAVGYFSVAARKREKQKARERDERLMAAGPSSLQHVAKRSGLFSALDPAKARIIRRRHKAGPGMNDGPRPSFGAAEVIEIASKFEAADDAFIIGGQATNFWAWFFQDREPELKLKGPFTSEDIDYFDSREWRAPSQWHSAASCCFQPGTIIRRAPPRLSP